MNLIRDWIFSHNRSKQSFNLWVKSINREVKSIER